MPPGSLQDAVHRSLQDPETFWGEAARAVHWYKPWEKVLDDSNKPFCRWFVGGELNTCYNALDLHVENGRAGQTALIYDSPVTGAIETFTFRELRDKVAHFAGALAGLGAGKSDRVIIYMPMVPEAVIAMLACARLGAVHSVVFGGFAANELAVRIDDPQPKVIVSASCVTEVNRIVAYKPLLDEAIESAGHKPNKCIILQRPAHPAQLSPGRDLDWHGALAGAEPLDCAALTRRAASSWLSPSSTTSRTALIRRRSNAAKSRFTPFGKPISKRRPPSLNGYLILCETQ